MTATGATADELLQIRKFTSEIAANAERDYPALFDSATAERASLGADDRLVPAVLELRAEVRKASYEAGYYGGFMPREVGGQSWSHTEAIQIYEALATGPAYPQAFWPDFVLHVAGQAWGPTPVLLFGDSFIQETYLAPLVTGEKTSCAGITDPDAGSDPQNMYATAEKVPGGYRLNGVKKFVGNAPYADYILFYARTSGERGSHGGISLFVVEKENPGFDIRRIFPVMEGRGNHGEIVMTDCLVPTQNLVGEEGYGFNYLMQFISSGRLMMGAQSAGAAQWCLDQAVERLETRSTFGVPLSERQGLQWRVAEADTQICLLRSLIYDAADALDNDPILARKLTAMAKLVGPRVYSQCADLAMQVHGGMGYLADLSLERHYRRSRGMRLWMGTDEIQLRSISRMLIRNVGPRS